MNATKQYDLTIIVPVYNEEDNIYSLEKALGEYLPKAKVSSAILFVNDGSKDASLNRIVEICGRNEHFFFVNLAQNRGLSGAIKAGIDTIQSQYTGYIDADLQTAPEDFNLLLEHIDEHEMVTGIRVGRKDSFVKNMSSKIANGFRRSMTHDGMLDTGCPLKIIRSDYAKKVPFFMGMHRFLPALVQMLEGKVKQVPVRHFPRVAGQSKFHVFNRLVGPLMDCFAYRWMRKRYINYRIDQTNV